MSFYEKNNKNFLNEIKGKVRGQYDIDSSDTESLNPLEEVNKNEIKKRILNKSPCFLLENSYKKTKEKTGKKTNKIITSNKPKKNIKTSSEIEHKKKIKLYTKAEKLHRDVLKLLKVIEQNPVLNDYFNSKFVNQNEFFNMLNQKKYKELIIYLLEFIFTILDIKNERKVAESTRKKLEKELNSDSKLLFFQKHLGNSNKHELRTSNDTISTNIFQSPSNSQRKMRTQYEQYYLNSSLGDNLPRENPPKSIKIDDDHLEKSESLNNYKANLTLKNESMYEKEEKYNASTISDSKQKEKINNKLVFTNEKMKNLNNPLDLGSVHFYNKGFLIKSERQNLRNSKKSEKEYDRFLDKPFYMITDVPRKKRFSNKDSIDKYIRYESRSYSPRKINQSSQTDDSYY